MGLACRVQIALLLLLLLPGTAYAPVFGLFPGLDALILRADAIAVVDILEQQTSNNTMEVHQQYRVWVARTLKGDLPEKEELRVSLRYLPFSVFGSRPETLRSSDLTFRAGHRYLVFFARNPQGGDAPIYRSMNCVGAHMEVSQHTNLSTFQKGDTKKAIAALIEGFLDVKRKELGHLERQASWFLGKESPELPEAWKDLLREQRKQLLLEQRERERPPARSKDRTGGAKAG